MPGPKSDRKSSPGERPDPNGNARKPNRKGKARLKARREDYDTRKAPEHGFDMHRPGSQNRKK
jgi:hypothetical protein